MALAVIVPVRRALWRFVPEPPSRPRKSQRDAFIDRRKKRRKEGYANSAGFQRNWRGANYEH